MEGDALLDGGGGGCKERVDPWDFSPWRQQIARVIVMGGRAVARSDR
jgi:hypothetical protein